MKRASCVAVLLLLPAMAWAGEKIDKSLDFVDGGSIDISNLNGQVRLTPWDAKSVKVTGEVGDYAQKLIFDRTGNRIRIAVQAKENFRSQSGSGDDLVISVPRSSNVSYSAVNSRFDAGELAGELTVNTVNGGVTVASNQGRLKATTVNGPLTIDHVKGDLEVHSVNGEVRVKGSTAGYGTFSTVNGHLDISCSCDAMQVSAVNGNVDVNTVGVQDLNLSSVSGNSRVRLGLKKGGTVNATTVNGHVTLSFIDDPSAYFSIRGRHMGTIVNDLTDDKPVEERPGGGAHLQFTHLNGDGKVSVTTVAGHVTLTRKQ
jgi:DUF4097 and DUF4098 domain-containing protein YvlB